MRKILYTWLLALFIVTGCQAQTNEHRTITDSAHAAAAGGDTAAALHLHKKALAHARRHQLQEHEARSLVHIANLLKRGDTAQSLVYLGNALRIAEQLNKHDLRAEILLAMSATYKQQKDYREALATLEAHQNSWTTSLKRPGRQNSNGRSSFPWVSRWHCCWRSMPTTIAVLKN